MHILVTRPKGKGESLVAKLEALSLKVHYQSVIDIAPGPDLDLLPKSFEHNRVDILIFVSTFAADYFISALKDPSIVNNSRTLLLAVGRSTAKRLQCWCNKAVLSPELETSEGLLKLPQLQADAVEGKKIVIVRGVGGRELLSEQLKSRKAKINYWQLYQRVVVKPQQQNWYDLWRSQQIDCIIVTSVAILSAIFDNLPPSAHIWLTTCRWVVASSRIAEKAQQLGIASQLITDAQGATDEALTAAVKRLIET